MAHSKGRFSLGTIDSDLENKRPQGQDPERPAEARTFYRYYAEMSDDLPE